MLTPREGILWMCVYPCLVCFAVGGDIDLAVAWQRHNPTRSGENTHTYGHYRSAAGSFGTESEKNKKKQTQK